MSLFDLDARARADITRLAAGATALGAGLLAYARLIEPNRLDVHPIDLTLKRLTPEFDGYRIAHFSDLHMEVWQNWTMLDQVIEATNAFEPDLIAITGDFVDTDAEPIADRLAAAALCRLKARDATVAVVGNHDYWNDVKDVRRLIQRAGIHELNNDVYTVRRGDASLHIGGVASMLESRARLDLVLDCLPDDSEAILLAHEPDFMYISASTRRFGLQLSGHSHGGQVRVPILMDAVLPKFGRKLVAGLAKKHGMYVYTNRGLGMSGMQIRFNCPPELTLITLHAPEKN